MVLTGLSAVIMPTLARLKRTAGEAMNSRLVLADAVETKLCALAVRGRPSLAPSAFAAFGLSWIDPLAGFVIAYLQCARPRGVGGRTGLRRR